MRKAFHLLPHEIFFGAFLLVTWLRLGIHFGFLNGDAVLYFLLIGANVISDWFYRSAKSALGQRLALLFYPIAMNIVFVNMKTAIPKLHPGRLDTFLQRIDQVAIGTNLSLHMEPLVHPVLTEIFSICYMLFFMYLLFSLVYYYCGELELLKKFVVGLFTIYGLGFFGYSFVPAVGPCVAMREQFSVTLTGWWFTKLNSAIVAAGSNGVDVFPSLHCAVSSFFLIFDYWHRRWRFRMYFIPCVGLWISTIYLRYHYLIDVLCGFALSAFALWLTRRVEMEKNTDGVENTEESLKKSEQSYP
jgi:hypothetical protein